MSSVQTSHSQRQTQRHRRRARTGLESVPRLSQGAVILLPTSQVATEMDTGQAARLEPRPGQQAALQVPLLLRLRGLVKEMVLP